MTSKWFGIIAIGALVIAGSSFSATMAHDDNEVRFTGVIESLPNTQGFIGDWRVSGRTVHVTNATRIEQEHGQVRVGATVEVEGNARADGSIDAEEIEVEGAETQEVEFTGIIQSLPGAAGFIGDWMVSGRIVHVTAATRIETENGPVVVGAMVEVKGTQRADGSIDAREIEIKENVAEFEGVIQSLPATPGFSGDWRIGGRIAHVTASTRIEGTPVVGATAEIKGSMRADGSIDATKIEVKGAEENENQNANFKGTIESLPSGGTLIGDWMVSGRLVHVTSSTRLQAKHGIFAVGARVKVKGMLMTDGSVVATKIQFKGSD